MQRKSSKYFETNSVPPSGDTTKRLRSETFTGTTKHEIINSSLAVPRIKMRNTIRGLGDTMCTPDRFTAQGATPSSSGGNTGTCLTDFRTSKRGRKSADARTTLFHLPSLQTSPDAESAERRTPPRQEKQGVCFRGSRRRKNPNRSNVLVPTREFLPSRSRRRATRLRRLS